MPNRAKMTIGRVFIVVAVGIRRFLRCRRVARLCTGRIRWIDGWPQLGDENGKVPDVMRVYKSGQPEAHIVCADDFSSSKLGLHWQWNHNPVDNAWSLTERPGFLRLKTSRVVENLYLAPNTLGHRAYAIEKPSATDGDGGHLFQIIGPCEVIACQLFWLQGPTIAIYLHF